MRQTAIQFHSHGMAVEGVLSTSVEAVSKPTKSGIVIICNPHPMLGGNMDNPIVSAICRALDGRDLASLRFNFRSVKGSEDRFTNGPTEGDDLIAAMHAMAHWPGIDNRRMAVAGYSFGAGVVLGSMSNLKTARGFAAVAPPVSAVRAMPARVGRPVLFVAGTNDRISPPVDLQRALDEVEGPVKFTELADTDHSLGGREWEAADAVAEFLATALST